MRRTVIVVEDFYDDPEAVCRYAMTLPVYHPYQPHIASTDHSEESDWVTTCLHPATPCPFKSSDSLIRALEHATGEAIDRDHWFADPPKFRQGDPEPADDEQGCLWNCSFHLKRQDRQKLGEGVHNHVTDIWNSVGDDGWAGIIYLNPSAEVRTGLHIWRNHSPDRDFDWMTSGDDWEMVDTFGNVFNRLLLVRGDKPHSGAAGWGGSMSDGRLFQTFFFRTHSQAPAGPVEVPIP